MSYYRSRDLPPLRITGAFGPDIYGEAEQAELDRLSEEYCQRHPAPVLSPEEDAYFAHFPSETF